MGLENCGIYFLFLHVSYLASIKLEHFELPYFGSKFLEESNYTLTCFVLNDFRGKCGVCFCAFAREMVLLQLKAKYGLRSHLLLVYPF